MTDAIFMGQTNTINHESPGKFQEARFEKIHNLSYSSATESSKLVANEIAHLIKTTVDRKFVLGLATGSSPIDVYKELVWLHHNPWSPFVGMSMARILKGRTFKEFVLGVYLTFD